MTPVGSPEDLEGVFLPPSSPGCGSVMKTESVAPADHLQCISSSLCPGAQWAVINPIFQMLKTLHQANE